MTHITKLSLASCLVLASATLLITPLVASSNPGVQFVANHFENDITKLYSADKTTAYFADFESLYRYLTTITYGEFYREKMFPRLEISL